MGSNILSNGLIPGQSIRFGSLDFIANATGYLALAATFTEGQSIRFVFPNFITDKFSKMRIRDSAPCPSAESSPRHPLGAAPPDHNGEFVF